MIILMRNLRTRNTGAAEGIDTCDLAAALLSHFSANAEQESGGKLEQTICTLKKDADAHGKGFGPILAGTCSLLAP